MLTPAQVTHMNNTALGEEKACMKIKDTDWKENDPLSFLFFMNKCNLGCLAMTISGWSNKNLLAIKGSMKKAQQMPCPQKASLILG